MAEQNSIRYGGIVLLDKTSTSSLPFARAPVVFKSWRRGHNEFDDVRFVSNRRYTSKLIHWIIESRLASSGLVCSHSAADNLFMQLSCAACVRECVFCFLHAAWSHLDELGAIFADYPGCGTDLTPSGGIRAFARHGRDTLSTLSTCAARIHQCITHSCSPQALAPADLCRTKPAVHVKSNETTAKVGKW